MVSSLVRRESLAAAFAAGIVAAITLDAFRLLVPFPGVPQVDAAARYGFNASVLVGNAAAGASWAVPLGIAIHFGVAIGWAFGYLALARSQPQLLTRPIVSGLGFGLVVWLLMVVMLLPIGKFAPPSFAAFDRDVVAHTVFFGLPLALVAARLAPPR